MLSLGVEPFLPVGCCEVEMLLAADLGDGGARLVLAGGGEREHWIVGLVTELRMFSVLDDLFSEVFLTWGTMGWLLVILPVDLLLRCLEEVVFSGGLVRTGKGVGLVLVGEMCTGDVVLGSFLSR